MRTESKNVRDVTYQLLREVGITTIFGNPGYLEETFLKNFPSDFRYVLALQESSAIAMADAFAQATGQPALVNLHSCGGLGNAMGNLITAFQNKTPLIVTAGQQTREMLLSEPLQTNVESIILPRPWIKWSYEPVRAQDIPAAFMRAIATALQPPAGPVFLSLPFGDWEEQCNFPATIRTVSRRFAPDPDRLAEFAKILSKASSPVVVYGASIDKTNSWSEAINFAELLGSPVWAAPICERASFPETHPLYCGKLPSAIGPLCEKLEGHDVVLVVGAPVFRYYNYVAGSYLPNGTCLLHISDDPSEIARAPVGDGLLGDSVLSLTALTQLLSNHRPKTDLQKKMPHYREPSSAHLIKSSNDGLLTAAQVFNALSEIRPDNAILVEESPSNRIDLHEYWKITKPASFFTFASGILGWNLPASVGIALAERDKGSNRPIILVIGDGSLQYSIQALWTAVQHNLPILIIVMRNGEYGSLKSFAKLEYISGVPGLDLPGLDIVSLAKGYGCKAFRLDDLDAIKKAALDAWTKSKPTLLEIPISP
jgi:benzoylformate decarboxylase